jgi:hypothetical protein
MWKGREGPNLSGSGTVGSYPAETGGSIGIWHFFANLDKYVDGITEMAEVVGVDHVSIDTDQHVSPGSVPDYTQWVCLVAAMLRTQRMELCEAALTEAGVFSAGEQWPKIEVVSAPRCIARAGPLLAQLAVMRLVARCRARGQYGSCFCCRGGRSGLVFGASHRRWHQVWPLRDWFCVAAGYSGVCEAPGRSFHPTAVERRNKPFVPRWVENKVN